MATADINRLMDNARIRLPGALDNAIKLEIFSVLNEFFQATNIWTEDIDFSVTPTNDSYLDNPAAYTYTITPVSGGVINRLIAVWNSDGFAQAATMPIPGEVILKFSPNEADTYTARVAKTVNEPLDNEGYPDFPAWVLNKYGNEMLDGVLARMMGQIAKPYSSAQLALYHMREFRRAIGRAKAEALHGNVYRGQSWRFPQSFVRTRHSAF